MQNENGKLVCDGATPANLALQPFCEGSPGCRVSGTKYRTKLITSLRDESSGAQETSNPQRLWTLGNGRGGSFQAGIEWSTGCHRWDSRRLLRVGPF